MNASSSTLLKKARRQKRTRREVTSENEVFPVPEASVMHKVIMSLVVLLPFLATIYGMYRCWTVGLMEPLHLAMVLGGWVMTGTGVTIGFHRLATHRSFETYGFIRAFWILCGAFSVEGSPMMWCAVHRRHHEVSDQPGDPHTPHGHGKGMWNMIRGLTFAHFGWLLTGFWSSPELMRYVPDLAAERWLVVIDKVYYLFVAAGLLIPAAIGGIASGTWSWEGAALGLLWGGLVRVFITHHVTWSINSICHVFGAKDYDAHDDSRNNPIFGILAFGEGWHNNHHAFPTSARHGLKWWQFDSSWMIIRTMQMLGLAWNVKVPSARQMELRALGVESAEVQP